MNTFLSISTVFKDKLSDKISFMYNNNSEYVDRIYEYDSLVNHYSNTLDNILSEPTHIINNIYLGNAMNACNKDTIDKYDFKAIVNVTEEIPNYFSDENIEYLKINIRDNQTATIKPYFECFDNFINNNKNNNILIHCYMGVSRSTSMVLYYLIKYCGYNLNDSINYVKEKRKFINPNKLLYEELKNYEAL